MGVLVQIRNVPEETRRRLKARAARRGLSLNAYLLELVERDVARPTADEVFERAARRRPARFSGQEIADLIRAERETRDEDLMRPFRE
jgi:plasmid stability protein